MNTQPSLFDEPQTPPQIKLNPTVPEAAKKRLSAQCERILALLQDGPLTTRQLSDIACQYNARLHELRNAGYSIVKHEKSVEKGVNVYELQREPKA